MALSKESASDHLGENARRVDNKFGRDRQSEANADLEYACLLGRRDAVSSLPSTDGGGKLIKLPSHRPNAAEERENRGEPFHEDHVREIETSVKQNLELTPFQIFAHARPMNSPVSDRLKELRLLAVPRLTIRKMADELGVSLSRYVYFEDGKRYKKTELPLDFTRQIADVLSRYDVDPAEVMKLAGLRDSEVEPEVREIEAQQPKLRFFTAQVALPSEAALAAMLEPLLAMIPEEATLAEAARILARRLPGGFAAIGPAVLEIETDEEPEHGARLQALSTPHPEQSWRSHR